MRSIAAAIFIVVSVHSVLAQPPSASPTFEVSTIKPASPDAPGMSFRFVGARRFTANNHTLKECIGYAYNLTPALIPGGPPWIEADRYDIVGETPGETKPPQAQILLMFQALLADRFKLQFHREQKETTVYNLVVAKSGSKIRESSAGPDAPPGLLIEGSNRGALLPARNATMAGFASLLQRVVLDRPVIDKTGLTSRYDFTLEWSLEGTRQGRGAPLPTGSDVDNIPNIFTSIQQLGLRLEPAKGLVDVLIIDRAERPDAN
jgi:uncharacterized protein (TIGR03435 family)